MHLTYLTYSQFSYTVHWRVPICWPPGCRLPGNWGSRLLPSITRVLGRPLLALGKIIYQNSKCGFHWTDTAFPPSKSQVMVSNHPEMGTVQSLSDPTVFILPDRVHAPTLCCSLGSSGNSESTSGAGHWHWSFKLQQRKSAGCRSSLFPVWVCRVSGPGRWGSSAVATGWHEGQGRLASSPSF